MVLTASSAAWPAQVTGRAFPCLFVRNLGATSFAFQTKSPTKLQQQLQFRV